MGLVLRQMKASRLYANLLARFTAGDTKLDVAKGIYDAMPSHMRGTGNLIKYVKAFRWIGQQITEGKK